MIDFLSYTLVFLSIILIPYSIYQLVIGLHYFKKTLEFKEAKKFNKFAILIAARNEDKVIGKTVESLHNLDYPKDLIDIYVAPNNCTDNTEEYAKKAGAKIFKVKNPVKSKGDVLHQMFDYLLREEDHDAYIIFDADNIVDKNFIKEMNKIKENGYDAAQGFRDSKNPYESWTSGCYTLYHYMINSFYNKPRTTLKLNNMIIGCGFMTTRENIQQLGGWNTKTITEDLEFTVLSTLKGSKIAYSDDAIFYDEQPNSFTASWHQRIRWSMGLKQGFTVNAKNVLKECLQTKNYKQFIDTLCMLTAGYISNLGLISMLLGTLILSLKTTARFGLYLFGLNVLGTVIAPMFFAIFILLINKRKILPMWKGILGFGVFLISWIPINLYVLFKDDVEWKEMKRDSVVNIQ